VSVKIWERVISTALVRADLPGNIAGRQRVAGWLTGPGYRLLQPGARPGNSPAVPSATVAHFWFQRGLDTAAERLGGGPATAPAPNLTHMSLEADAHVIDVVPALNADAYVIFHTR
jgi:hypothetical protein